MRELRFRAWDKKQKKMLYGVSIGTIRVWDENAPLLSNEFSYSEDCIFEQYTGLKDKNGKEIYEGDIVKLWDREPELVVWDNLIGAYDPLSWEIFDTDECEVIGNIHENPELI